MHFEVGFLKNIIMHLPGFSAVKYTENVDAEVMKIKDYSGPFLRDWLERYQPPC